MDFTVRVSEGEFAKIKLKSELYGYKTISAYFRDRILKTNANFEEKIRKIHEKVMSNGKEYESKSIANRTTV